jgi:hypothetical protein
MQPERSQMTAKQVRNLIGQHTLKILNNEGKSAASFCRQVAARFPDMFCNFYLMENHKIAKNSTTTEARKNKQRFGLLRILKF